MHCTFCAEPAATPAAGSADGAAQEQRIAALIAALGSPEFAVREKATEDLLKIGLPAVPALKEAAKSDDPEVFERAEKILTGIRNGLGGVLPGEIVEMARNFDAVPEEHRAEAIGKIVAALGDKAGQFIAARVMSGRTVDSNAAMKALRGCTSATVLKETAAILSAELKRSPANRPVFYALLVVTPPRPTEVPKATGPVTLDGDLKEWKDVPALPVRDKDGKPGHVQALWDEKGLYLAATATDPDIKFNQAEPWRADCLEVWVDRAYTREIEQSDPATAAHYMLSPVGNDGDGNTLIAFGKGDVPPTVKWKKTGTGYTMEVFVPVAALKPAKWKAGTKFGFDYALSNDGVRVEQYNKLESPVMQFKSPLQWGALVLKAPKRTGPDARPQKEGPRPTDAAGDAAPPEGAPGN